MLFSAHHLWLDEVLNSKLRLLLLFWVEDDFILEFGLGFWERVVRGWRGCEVRCEDIGLS